MHELALAKVAGKGVGWGIIVFVRLAVSLSLSECLTVVVSVSFSKHVEFSRPCCYLPSPMRLALLLLFMNHQLASERRPTA